MSGATAATWIGVGLTAAGLGASIRQGNVAQSNAKQAQRQAQADADAAATQADIANNKANQKQANPLVALASAQLAGKSGAGSTLLTGAQGVDLSSAMLGKSTLLGS